MKNYFLLFYIILFSCGTKEHEIVVLPEQEVGIDLSSLGKEKLSEYLQSQFEKKK